MYERRVNTGIQLLELHNVFHIKTLEKEGRQVRKQVWLAKNFQARTKRVLRTKLVVYR